MFSDTIFSPCPANILSDKLLEIIVKFTCVIYFSFTPWPLKVLSLAFQRNSSQGDFFDFILTSLLSLASLIEDFFTLWHFSCLILVTWYFTACLPIFLMSHVSPLYIYIRSSPYICTWPSLITIYLVKAYSHVFIYYLYIDHP